MTHFIVAVGSVGDSSLRRRLFEHGQALGLGAVNAIHPSSVISASAALGRGVAIMAGSVVNARARVGDNCIVNTSSVVEHDCRNRRPRPHCERCYLGRMRHGWCRGPRRRGRDGEATRARGRSRSDWAWRCSGQGCRGGTGCGWRSRSAPAKRKGSMNERSALSPLPPEATLRNALEVIDRGAAGDRLWLRTRRRVCLAR